MGSFNYLFCALSWLLILFLGINHTLSEEYKTYIIHMDHSQKPSSFLTHESWHQSILRSLSNPVLDDQKFLYSYNHVMHGFSARLTPSQVAEIRESQAHLASQEESIGKLVTTYSTTFLGLNHDSGLWPSASYGEGVIIGLIDSGVWPESLSFSDNGMPPVPRRWKGKCQNGTGTLFACNNKLIGARTFIKGFQAAIKKKLDATDYSPRDQLGHGTHTSSTAAGNYVEGASQFGFASGTAKGVAPRAYVAMYKVSPDGFVAESDVLAAMDQAIVDGIDIMSLSIAFRQKPYFQDVIATASLSAMERGIVVACAAGNQGHPNTTHNAAPWITTVGASTLDRSFVATMTLGNGLSFQGSSSHRQSVYISDTLLYYGGDNFKKSKCKFKSLNKKEVAGKVVVCRSSNHIDRQMDELNRVGAYAGILMTDSPLFFYDDQIFPVLVLSTSYGALVTEYARNVFNATVASMRFGLTSFGAKPAPQVADFSSRGPDPIFPGLLKPDILAPGVDILAAVPPLPWSLVDLITSGNYELVTDYALYSGTSMATPHVAGVAALLKAVHPEWSPAAIRSAMMTTAYTMDNNRSILTDQSTNLPATPLDFGAGHINPNRAMDPGLIYDLDFQDYVDFICGLGYNETNMKALLRRNQWNCSQERANLNYPSFVAIFSNESKMVRRQVFNRVLTNVGDDQSVYQSTVAVPYGLDIKVEPSTLSFTQKYQKQNFSITVEVYGQASPVVYGYLTWFDDHKHIVSSPVVVLNS
ncbi:hypothetical protein SLE2022_214050 [Rubroshorea leprosula]